MADKFYTVDVRMAGSQLPVPAQTGITDKRVADALKGLYPKRLQPTVQQDTYSISGMARQLAKESRAEPLRLGSRQAGPAERNLIARDYPGPPQPDMQASTVKAPVTAGREGPPETVATSVDGAVSSPASPANQPAPSLDVTA